MTAVNEWSRWDEGGPTSPIPDLTPSAHTMAPCCGAGWRGLVCTRLPGHTGRHAAGDGSCIVAVWADPASEEPTNAEFDAAVERAAQVIARDCQVCSGGLVVPTGVEYLGATEYGGCSDCYGLAAQIVQVVLHPKEDT